MTLVNSMSSGVGRGARIVVGLVMLGVGLALGGDGWHCRSSVSCPLRLGRSASA